MKYAAASDGADAFARFVFVDPKGEPREVYEREAEWLATPFDPTDGDRPYIKTSYESLTPDGSSMHGFLERRLLPRKLHDRILRRDAARRPQPQRLRRMWILGPALGIALASLLAGYLALITTSFVAWQFMRPGYRGLGIVLFVAAMFFVTPFYFVVGPLNVVLTADRFRFLQLFCTTAAWLGFTAGAVWVLWLHGDPSRILLYR